MGLTATNVAWISVNWLGGRAPGGGSGWAPGAWGTMMCPTWYKYLEIENSENKGIPLKKNIYIYIYIFF